MTFGRPRDPFLLFQFPPPPSLPFAPFAKDGNLPIRTLAGTSGQWPVFSGQSRQLSGFH